MLSPLGSRTFAANKIATTMIKQIICQLLHIAKRLYAQLSNSEIVRIVKAWVVRLLGKKEEQTSKVSQQKTQQKSNSNSPMPKFLLYHTCYDIVFKPPARGY